MKRIIQHIQQGHTYPIIREGKTIAIVIPADQYARLQHYADEMQWMGKG